MERTASGNGSIEVVPTPSCWAANVEADVRRARERAQHCHRLKPGGLSRTRRHRDREHVSPREKTKVTVHTGKVQGCDRWWSQRAR